MKKNRYVWIYVTEVIVLLFFMVPLFRKLPSYEYDFSQMESWTEYGMRQENGFYINTEEYSGIFTYNPFFELERGSYAITINYETDREGNVAYLSNNSRNSFGAVLCDDVLLSPNKTSITFQAYLKERVSMAHVMTRYEGGSLLVKSIRIAGTRDMNRSELVTVLFFITLLNVLLWLSRSGYFRRLSREQINVMVILGAAVVYLFYPFFTDKVLVGTDMVFHMLRIESIKEGLLAGDFFAKIHSAYLEGYGYASGVFYPDVLLYFPALLRVIGFTVQGSYKIYMFAVNIATCISAYSCIRGIVGNRYLSALGTVLYLYVPFRLFGLYFAHTVGASAALMFLPLVVLGLYRIYTMDTRDDGYKHNFILPTIGYAGLLSTHVLTTEMVGAITIFVCIVCARRTFEKERFLVLLKTLLCSVVICMGFLVPFLDYYLNGEFKINAEPTAMWIQQEGLSLSQLLQMFPAFENNETFSTGFNLDYQENSGVAVLALAGVFPYAYFMADEEKRRQARHMWLVFWIGVGTVFLATCYFPWDMLRRVLDEVHMAFLVDSLQYAMRFMEVAPLMLIVAGCHGMRMLLEDNQKEVVRNVSIMCVGLVIVSSGYLVNHALNIGESKSVYDLQKFTGRHTWSQEEYLPKDTDEGYLTAIGTVAYDEVQISNYNKKYLDIRMDVVNDGNDSCVDLPLLYYKGYQAVASDGTRLNAYESDNNNVVRVDIPAGFSGNVHVSFRQPVPWRIAEIISIISTIGFGAYIVCCRKKKCNII